MIACPHCGAEFDPFPRSIPKPQQLFAILHAAGDWVNARPLTEALYRRPYHPDDARTMRVHIFKLRRSLAERGEPWRIESGTRQTALGYRLVALDAWGTGA